MRIEWATAMRGALRSLVALGLNAWLCGALMADPAEPLARVRTLPVRQAPIGATVRGYGTIGVAPAGMQTLSLAYPVRVLRLAAMPGQRVERGAPLLAVQADPAAAQAAAQAANAVSLAQGELARTQTLYDERLATRSQLAAAEKALADARVAQAAQTQMGVRQGEIVLVAPADGVVWQLPVTAGDRVPAGAALLQLARRDAPANVVLGVEPSEAAQLRAGDQVNLHVLSADLASGSLIGSVAEVGAAVDAQTQQVMLSVRAPVGRDGFLPGTKVAGEIAAAATTHWVVPRAAVLRDGQGAYLFQVSAEHRARRVPVTVRVENGGRYGVDGPLDAALPLVALGNAELEDGMAVEASAGSAP